MHLSILLPAVVNGVLTGALYALIALGLTLVYGVLHIINFAHGALLTAALFAAFFMHKTLGIDPYLAVLVLTPAFFVFGYGLQRFVIGPASHGNDGNILLVTLGLAVIIENALLFAFRGDTRTIDVSYGFAVVPVAGMFISVPRLVGFGGAVVVALLLWLLLGWTDTGKAIRAAAKEKLGAQLCGVDVAHIYAVTFGLGSRLRRHRCLPADSDLLRQPACRQCLRADCVHDRRAGRYGLDSGRAARRPVRRRGGKPVRALSR